MRNKISIIIPVFNTEQYITDCIKSVTKQTYKDIEILIINDNSNEECKELLEKLAEKDNRIRLFHFEKREGVGAARNFGIKKAQGEFVYFLDSDDYLAHKTLELLIRHIKNHNLIFGRIKSTNFRNGIAIILEGLFKIKLYTDERYNLIKDRTALNCLFKRKFIAKNNLSFSENVDLYSDLSLMVPALIESDQVSYLKEAVYFKRKRNDPITNPSLNQYDNQLKIQDFLKQYNQLKDKYQDDLANEFLDKQLLNFYRKDIVTYFKHGDGINLFYDELVASLKKVNTGILNKHSMILRKEVHILKNGNISAYKKINAKHHLLRQIREGLKTKRKFYILLYRRIFMKLPIKKELIFLESFLGKNYSDSPKYIYEYMLNNNINYKFVWSLNEKKELPGNPIQVKRFSLRYFYYLARAKYWVSNSRLPRYLDKREGNVYIQTWHGTPLKTLVFDMDDIYSADPKYKKNFYDQSRRWDYLSSPNKYSSEIFKRAFLFDKKMLEFGYPRNDILYQKNTKPEILNLKQKMNLPNDKKIVLYAPTWRDDEFYARGKYKFTLQLDLERMRNQLGKDHIVLLRMHYFIASQMDISDFEGFVYDFSNYDDIAELYLVSDILITDYSSVFFDYANLKRPILFYTYDLEKYRDQLRGFYIDVEREVPGPLLKTSDEVIHSIQNISDVQIEYEKKYEDFYERFCKWDDGCASEKTVKAVFNNE
jgi:CDP-glycerol glycerophosphotransferase